MKTGNAVGAKSLNYSILFNGQLTKEEPMKKTRPFDISKQVVYQAYLRVKSNGGSAGIDEESIELN